MYVVIGCDVDPDVVDFQPTTVLEEVWRGVDEGISVFQRLSDGEFGGRPPA